MHDFFFLLPAIMCHVPVVGCALIVAEPSEWLVGAKSVFVVLQIQNGHPTLWECLCVSAAQAFIEISLGSAK